MAKQKISTEEVKTEMTALDSILQKNAEMEQAVTAGIQAMNFGMTQNMQFNMTEKSLSVMQGLKSLTESLRQGKTVLGQVVSAYESTDANLKRNVEDWVGGTEVTSSGSSAEGKSDAGATEKSSEAKKKEYTLWDATVDSFGDIPNEFKELQDAYDSLKKWIGSNEGIETALGIFQIFPDKLPVLSDISHAVKTAGDILEDPENIGQFGWDMLETFSSALGKINPLTLTEEILDKIPFYHDYYTAHGGYYGGLSYGVKEIANSAIEYVSDHGGFFSAWWDGFKSIFH